MDADTTVHFAYASDSQWQHPLFIYLVQSVPANKKAGRIPPAICKLLCLITCYFHFFKGLVFEGLYGLQHKLIDVVDHIVIGC